MLEKILFNPRGFHLPLLIYCCSCHKIVLCYCSQFKCKRHNYFKYDKMIGPPGRNCEWICCSGWEYEKTAGPPRSAASRAVGRWERLSGPSGQEEAQQTPLHTPFKRACLSPTIKRDQQHLISSHFQNLKEPNRQSHRCQI